MIEDPKKGRVIASSICLDIFWPKKATFIRSDKRGLDGHDSQEIPEENTGITGLDIIGELVSAEIRRDASILDIRGVLNSSY